MAVDKKNRSAREARSKEPVSQFLPADPETKNPLLLGVSIVLLIGWLGLLAWIVTRIAQGS